MFFVQFLEDSKMEFILKIVLLSILIIRTESQCSCGNNIHGYPNFYCSSIAPTLNQFAQCKNARMVTLINIHDDQLDRRNWSDLFPSANDFHFRLNDYYCSKLCNSVHIEPLIKKSIKFRSNCVCSGKIPTTDRVPIVPDQISHHFDEEFPNSIRTSTIPIVSSHRCPPPPDCSRSSIGREIGSILSSPLLIAVSMVVLTYFRRLFRIRFPRFYAFLDSTTALITRRPLPVPQPDPSSRGRSSGSAIPSIRVEDRNALSGSDNPQSLPLPRQTVLQSDEYKNLLTRFNEQSNQLITSGEEVTSSKAEISNLKNEIEKYKKELDGAKREISNFNLIKSDSIHQLESMKHALHQSQSQLTQTREDLSQSERLIDSLEAKKNDLSQQNESLKHELMEHKTKLLNEEDLIRKTNEENYDLDNELKRTRDQLKQLFNSRPKTAPIPGFDMTLEEIYNAVTGTSETDKKRARYTMILYSTESEDQFAQLMKKETTELYGQFAIKFDRGSDSRFSIRSLQSEIDP